MRQARQDGGRIACVVLNYNDAETTLRLVRRLEQSRLLTGIAVVDNASDDGSWERLKQLERGGADQPRRADVRLMRTERNGGYGSGNQAGIGFACRLWQPDYIIIANPDIEVDDTCIRRVREALAAQEDGAAASALVRSPQGKLLFSYWDLPGLAGELLDAGLVTRRLFAGRLTTPPERLEPAADRQSRLVGALPGSFFMLKMSCFSEGEAGALFDPGVFLYCEEKILAQKLRARGLRELLVTDVSYVHAHSVSIDRSVGKIAAKQAILHQSRLWYYRHYLHCGPLRMAAARLWLALVLAEVRFLTGVVGLRW